jgi:hypothetical protein
MSMSPMQGNCTQPQSILDLQLPLSPLQCLLATNRTVFYIWQPGNVWLDHIHIHALSPNEAKSVIIVDRAVNLTKEYQPLPTQLFLTNSSISGDGKGVRGLRVFNGSAFVDSESLCLNTAATYCSQQ